VSFRLLDRGRVAGNREVFRSTGRAHGAAGEKGVRGGNRVPPTGVRRSRATGVEVEA
jgi:hypothetical protein